MYESHGYRHWLRNFVEYMAEDLERGCTYSFRGGRPTKEVQYIYLVIGGRIRFRINFVMGKEGRQTFDDGRSMDGKWIIGTGPLVRAPYKMPMKGFQGFRYTDKLF